MSEPVPIILVNKGIEKYFLPVRLAEATIFDGFYLVRFI